MNGEYVTLSEKVQEPGLQVYGEYTILQTYVFRLNPNPIGEGLVKT